MSCYHELEREYAEVKSQFQLAQAANEKLRNFIADIIPRAKWESCKYKNDDDTDVTTHCCDWSAIVAEGIKLLNETDFGWRVEDEIFT